LRQASGGGSLEAQSSVWAVARVVEDKVEGESVASSGASDETDPSSPRPSLLRSPQASSSVGGGSGWQRQTSSDEISPQLGQFMNASLTYSCLT
jgi:hypothetical protein